MHFCQDELMAVLALIPFVHAIRTWLKGRVYGKRPSSQ